MLLSRDAIAAAHEEGIRAEDFYRPSHQRLYEAIQGLWARGEPVDPTTVGETIRQAGKDPSDARSALLQLMASTPASANATHYAHIVSALALLRRLIAAGGAIAELGYQDWQDAEVALDEAEAALFSAAARSDRGSSRMLAEAIQVELDAMECRQPGLLGVPSGYRGLDRWLLGFQPAQMIVLAGRPASGKSAFALGAALHVAEQGEPVAYFSLEMSESELTARALSLTARLPLRAIRAYSAAAPTLDEHDWGRLTRAVAALSAAPLVIEDSGHCTIMDIRSRARRLLSRHGRLGLVVVDYIQLMTPLGTGRRTAENRQVEVSEMSRGLKLLARELECPVLALAQLNRQVEYRAEKRPTLADLRDSGALEQDSDVVLALYRDELYHPDTAKKGTAECLVLKHRNGKTGPIRMAFDAESTRFSDLAGGGEPDPVEQPSLGAAGGSRW